MNQRAGFGAALLSVSPRYKSQVAQLNKHVGKPREHCRSGNLSSTAESLLWSTSLRRKASEKLNIVSSWLFHIRPSDFVAGNLLYLSITNSNSSFCEGRSALARAMSTRPYSLPSVASPKESSAKMARYNRKFYIPRLSAIARRS